MGSALMRVYDGGKRESFTGAAARAVRGRAGLDERTMPNIAAVLKDEIARIARKEVRAQTGDFKKASAQYRSTIAALRRRVDELERQLKRVGKGSARASASANPAEDQDASGRPRRFSPARLASQRRKLGLSAADFATLLGVSGQSVYKWEHGEARPRARQLEAIAALRGIGKREAAARLEKMQEK